MSDEPNNPFFPPSMDNALKNITDKPTQNIGTTFADIWYLIFGGISQVAEKRRIKYAHDLEIYQKELFKQIDEIPTEKRIEPSIHVTSQALENSKYCISSDILREMFVNLISGTMHKDIEPHIHPAFPEILKQLSDKDGIFLKCLKDRKDIPVCQIGVENSDGGFMLCAKNVCIPPSSSLSEYDCAVCISSLVRAGILEITYSEYVLDNESYNKIKELSIYSEIEDFASSMGCKAYLKKGITRLTHFGAEFIQVCV